MPKPGLVAWETDRGRQHRKDALKSHENDYLVVRMYQY